jgi:DNA mismatch endonuclease (patch repair protein)
VTSDTEEPWAPPPGSWASSSAIRRTMVGNRPRDTAPELAVRSAVHRLGLRYRVSVRPVPALRRTADLVFRRVQLAVFVDGCFWHGCPEHATSPALNRDFWRTKLDRNRMRDEETDAALERAGWAVLRIWEHEDPHEAALRIGTRLAELRATTSPLGTRRSDVASRTRTAGRTRAAVSRATPRSGRQVSGGA